MIKKETLSDAALSKKLGHYQTMSYAWFFIGLFGTLGGTLAFFVLRDAALRAILTGVLFSGGICCAVFLSGGARKKLDALMQEQLGGFFRAEFRKAFGPDLRTPGMCIDRAYLERAGLVDRPWDVCTVERFHEGEHRGVLFSAANVQLDRLERVGNAHDGYENRPRSVFRGLVLRCETRSAPPSAIRVTARTADTPIGVRTGHKDFDRRFRAEAAREQDVFCLLTPDFMDFLGEFERQLNGTLLGLSWDGRVLSLALETDYGFAAVAGHVDVRDLDAVRRSYIASLQEMARTLDLLFGGCGLFAARE